MTIFVRLCDAAEGCHATVEVAVVLDDVDRPLEVVWEYCEIAARAMMTMRTSAVADWTANRAAEAHVR